MPSTPADLIRGINPYLIIYATDVRLWLKLIIPQTNRQSQMKIKMAMHDRQFRRLSGEHTRVNARCQTMLTFASNPRLRVTMQPLAELTGAVA